MPLTLRTAVDSDWPQICHVDGRAFGFHWTDEEVASERMIDRALHPGQVLCHDGARRNQRFGGGTERYVDFRASTE